MAKDPNNEKSSSSTASNVQLKVTEEHVRQLLEAVQQLPDDEWLLQRHFVAVLTSVGFYGRQSSKGHRNGFIKLGSSPLGPPFIPIRKGAVSSTSNTMPSNDSLVAEKKALPSADLVAAALAQLDNQDAMDMSNHDQNTSSTHQAFVSEPSSTGKDHLVITLDFPESANEHILVTCDPEFPHHILVTLPGSISASNSLHRLDRAPTNSIRNFSKKHIEQRYRMACKMSIDGELRQWAAAAGMGLGIVGGPSTSKIQSSGKRRLNSEPGKASQRKKRRPAKVMETNNAQENNLESQADVSSLNNGNDGGEILKDHFESESCDAVEASAAATLRTISQAMPERVDRPGHDTFTCSHAIPEGPLGPGTSAQMPGCTLSSLSHQERISDASGYQACSVSSPNEKEWGAVSQMPLSRPGVSVDVRESSVVGDSKKVTFRENLCDVPIPDGYRVQRHERLQHSSKLARVGDAVRLLSDVQSNGSGMLRSSYDSEKPQTTASEQLSGGFSSSVHREPVRATSPATDVGISLPQFLQSTIPPRLSQLSNSHRDALGTFGIPKVLDLPTTSTSSPSLAPSGSSFHHH